MQVTFYPFKHFSQVSKVVALNHGTKYVGSFCESKVTFNFHHLIPVTLSPSQCVILQYMLGIDWLLRQTLTLNCILKLKMMSGLISIILPKTCDTWLLSATDVLRIGCG